MSVASREYTEHDVEEFFDQTLHNYLSFWDTDGVLHTGYFAPGNEDDYQAAAQHTSAVLAGEMMIDGSSHVLDAGSGCGNFLLYLARESGCSGEGLDLSEERVKFAAGRLTGEPDLRISFRHGSITQMPYQDGTFTHVVSQDALCLVPDKPRSHAEIARVLAPGGIFAFSDFLQPKEHVSERARKHVFDRVRWNGGYSLIGYQEALDRCGFEILLARNLRSHIWQTYRVLGQTATERAQSVPDQAARDWMLSFAESCREMQIAIDDEEFSWGIFVARKRSAA
ncbi:MAG TPA: methyltransferase domain-containing protein [Trebonia sp.]|jgi:cyclopropane fatty-acyl-phospholipid synthase-like methyltransferase|nr:methyltransferase domain-containing protein [Trebonia sp.]